MFATIELQKPGCGRPVLPSASSEALGQVPGGSGLGVNAEDNGSDHGSSRRTQSTTPSGNLSGNLGEFWSKVPKQGEKLLLSSSGYRSEGVNRARSGGIDQGKPVFGTFKGERDEAKVMGNPSKNPYSKSDSISYMVCDLPPGGRDQNIFPLFRLFRGNGSWCRPSEVEYEIFFACDR